MSARVTMSLMLGLSMAAPIQPITGSSEHRISALRDIVGTWQSDTVNGTSARSRCAASPDGDSVICDQQITTAAGTRREMSFFVPDTAGDFVFYNLVRPGDTMRPVPLVVARHVWTYGGRERSADGRFYRTVNLFGGGRGYIWRQESSADGVTWVPGVQGHSHRLP